MFSLGRPNHRKEILINRGINLLLFFYAFYFVVQFIICKLAV